MAGRVISPTELTPVLRALHGHATLRTRDVPKIGVCVSGGPDSMALAYLLQQSRKCLEYKLEISAWIVDHKARPGSTEEAQQVTANLDRIGISSSILTMSWPDGIDPLKLSGFESQARNKRYHLLAQAAIEHRIQHLFLGHHADDQVETVLMRLIRNGTLSLKGLAGMSTVSAVPAAFDTFGVHVASQQAYLKVHENPPPATQSQQSASTERRVRRACQLAIPGGIQLVRPLLQFTKKDLVATCDLNNVPYAIDPTNRDPRASVRNAVRHLRTYSKLPQALQKDRILALQRQAQQYLDNVKAAGDAVLKTCEIRSLDVRSGVARVYIPYKTCGDSLELEGYAQSICQICEMVTPNVRVNHTTQVPPRILTNFCDVSNHSQLKVAKSTAFSYEKVQFLPDSTVPGLWTVSRQPMRPIEIEDNTRNFVPNKTNTSSACQLSEFMLWDNRFWIRVHTSSVDMMKELGIRPLQEEDMTTIAAKANGDTSNAYHIRHRLLEVIHTCGPGKTRFTLPVLTFQGRLVALPTLGYKLPGVMEETKLSLLTWDVLYNSFRLASKFSDSLRGRSVA